jgi:hypothetical protein
MKNILLTLSMIFAAQASMAATELAKFDGVFTATTKAYEANFCTFQVDIQINGDHAKIRNGIPEIKAAYYYVFNGKVNGSSSPIRRKAGEVGTAKATYTNNTLAVSTSGYDLEYMIGIFQIGRPADYKEDFEYTLSADGNQLYMHDKGGYQGLVREDNCVLTRIPRK